MVDWQDLWKTVGVFIGEKLSMEIESNQEEDKSLPRKGGGWLGDILGGTKRLESEYDVCPDCGKENIEFKIWRLGDGSIKKLKYCPDCSVKYEEEQRRAEEVAKQVEIASTRRRRRESCGIPPKFQTSDFSAFEKGWQDKALKACQTYAEGFPVDKRPIGYPSLYLWSIESWGTGKTHLACAIIHRILDRWTGNEKKGCPRVIFLSEPELFDRIQNTYSFSQQEKEVRESESDIIKGIVYADLVVLDDVGKEVRQKPDFVHKTLFKIINGRYDQRLPMIITANLEPAQLHQHLDEYPGEASFGRFYDEMCGGKSVRVDGKSYRRKE